MWYRYTMEYYPAIKRNEIGSFVETWMDLETVIRSEVSQKAKNKYCICICNTYIWNLKKNDSEEPRGRTRIKIQT